MTPEQFDAALRELVQMVADRQVAVSTSGLAGYDVTNERKVRSQFTLVSAEYRKAATETGQS